MLLTKARFTISAAKENKIISKIISNETYDIDYSIAGNIKNSAFSTHTLFQYNFSFQDIMTLLYPCV